MFVCEKMKDAIDNSKKAGWKLLVIRWDGSEVHCNLA